MPDDGLLPHGGRLGEAALRYGIAPDAWLDLSTGISPVMYPLSELASVLTPALWQRLPDDRDALAGCACRYYNAPQTLPVAGSQAAIQALPRLRARCRVGVTRGSYAEHASAWRRCGHDVRLLEQHGQDEQCKQNAQAIEQAIDDLDVLIIIHPDNPSGRIHKCETLVGWHERLAARGGWLIVDEAFIDATPECSLAPRSSHRGLIVLRSLGKFFGLAGARVGFVCAEQNLLQRLEILLGPWTISAPARLVAQHALSDATWQARQCIRLNAMAARLMETLNRHGLTVAGHTALFCRVPVPVQQAEDIHDQLARQGILVRLFGVPNVPNTSNMPGDPSALRFGLPGDEAQWQRLEQALSGLKGASKNLSF